jgi:hypothetical protein
VTESFFTLAFLDAHSCELDTQRKALLEKGEEVQATWSSHHLRS